MHHILNKIQLTIPYMLTHIYIKDSFIIVTDRTGGFVGITCNVPVIIEADTTRDCKTCGHSNDGKCAFTEECHECMWVNKYIEADKEGEQE